MAILGLIYTRICRRFTKRGVKWSKIILGKTFLYKSKSASTSIRLGNVHFVGHQTVFIVVVAIGFTAPLQLKSKVSVVAALVESGGNVRPIYNTVERQKMQIIEPESMASEIAHPEIVVDMRGN